MLEAGETVAIRAVVAGKVQGVGFRFFVSGLARLSSSMTGTSISVLEVKFEGYTEVDEIWMYMTSCFDDINLSTMFPYGRENRPDSSCTGGIVSRIKSGVSISCDETESIAKNPRFLTNEG